jgi:hypothetical protein
VTDDQDRPHLLHDLTARELELVGAARRGARVVCSDEPLKELASTDDPQHVIRAELIRELLTERRGKLDPRGVQLIRARLIGVLDLDCIDTQVGLTLRGCVLDEAMYLRDAHFPRLNFSGSQVGTIHLDRLRVDGDLFMCAGFRANGTSPDGTVRLVGAHIGGQLDMSSAILTNNSGPALSADGLQVDAGLILTDRFKATGVDHGAQH